MNLADLESCVNSKNVKMQSVNALKRYPDIGSDVFENNTPLSRSKKTIDYM